MQRRIAEAQRASLIRSVGRKPWWRRRTAGSETSADRTASLHVRGEDVAHALRF